MLLKTIAILVLLGGASALADNNDYEAFIKKDASSYHPNGNVISRDLTTEITKGDITQNITLHVSQGATDDARTSPRLTRNMVPGKITVVFGGSAARFGVAVLQNLGLFENSSTSRPLILTDSYALGDVRYLCSRSVSNVTPSECWLEVQRQIVGVTYEGSQAEVDINDLTSEQIVHDYVNSDGFTKFRLRAPKPTDSNVHDEEAYLTDNPATVEFIAVMKSIFGSENVNLQLPRSCSGGGPIPRTCSKFAMVELDFKDAL